MFSLERSSRLRSLTAICSIILWCAGALTFADPHFYVRKKIPDPTQRTSTETYTQPKADVRQILPGFPPRVPHATELTVEKKSTWKASTMGDPSIRTVPYSEKSSHSGKPRVHFPQGMLPSEDSTASSDSTVSFQKYPKPYKPLLTPYSPQQREWHMDAIEAYELGNEMGRENRLQNAISAYQKALQLSPGFADPYIGLSTAYMMQNNWEDALASVQKGLSLRQGFMDPSNITRAQYNLSAAYCVMDHYGKAKQSYDKVKRANHPLAPQLWAYLQQNCKR